METYLITGGAGFIGSNFIEYLFSIKSDINVINVDKLTYAGRQNNVNIDKNKNNYTFIREDICNKQEMNKIFHDMHPDYVVNFAAESHVDRSIQDSEVFINTNVLGTEILLRASQTHNVKKYIQISTDEVYGTLEKGTYANEGDPLRPTNPYAASKGAADLIVQSFYYTYKLPVIITRCTNNYGPKQHHEKFIPMVIRSCMEGKEIPIYGDGRYTRDWIHVYDHCRAIYRVIQDGKIGEVYHIGAGNEKENIELVEIIMQLVKEQGIQKGKPYQSLNEGLIQLVKNRQGHDRRYALRTDKIERELGWKPEMDFSTGLANTVEWYSLHSKTGEL